jgi:hypothetical protein
MKWSHEMAHTKPRPAAAHPAQDPALAPGAAPAPGSPAAAVHAALAASPGATIAVKPAARTALLAMEAAGTATRVKGSKPGIPDTWTLAEPAPERTGPALDPEGEQAGQPVDGPGGSLDGAGEDETAGSTGQERTAGTDDPAPEDGGNAEGGTSAAPGPETEQPKSHDDAPADGDPEDAAPGEQDDDEAAPDSEGPQDPDGSDDPREEDAAQADASGEAGDAPDPALVTDLTERITQIKATADAAAGVVDGGGDLRAALAGLDEIYEQAAQARRSLKAALGGRKTPAARPGGLRDKVLAHLDDHPDGAFTPHEIHKVLGNSSGAIANALDTLVKLGEADLATDC